MSISAPPIDGHRISNIDSKSRGENPMKVGLEGKTAIVTGASRGLGKAIAEEFARAGAAVMVIARESADLQHTLDAVKRSSDADHRLLGIDLTAQDAAAMAVRFAASEWGRLDILVNCAGTTKRGDFHALTDADWHDGFALKFHATVRLCRAAWPMLVERKGVVLNTIGVSSRTPSADFTIGGSVNSALLNFTKALADLGRTDGVRVNAINPGYIRTDRLSHRIQALVRERGISEETAQAQLLHEYGLQRFGEPRDVAHLATFLASDCGSYIHGSTIDIDGGASKGI
ncbi:SDR family oxidoreductase [Burkholderia multivorans]|jgi:3-oxoacyl-[acyl-carrier protein] reductase|nr:SDR family oxidoreductase [Burkholderia multivorans]QET38754.1 SDR family oxidoreductase [Burkholderia multivorans]